MWPRTAAVAAGSESSARSITSQTRGEPACCRLALHNLEWGLEGSALPRQL